MAQPQWQFGIGTVVTTIGLLVTGWWLMLVVTPGQAAGWQQRLELTIREWRLSLPGDKLGAEVLQVAGHHLAEYPIEDLSFELSATIIDADTQSVVTTESSAHGMVMWPVGGQPFQLDLMGQSKWELQGLTFEPQGQFKADHHNLYLKLKEPIWPVKGFYVLAEDWVAWPLPVAGLGKMSSFDWTQLVTQLAWSPAESVVVGPERLLRTTATVSAEQLQAWLGDTQSIRFQPTTVTIWVQPGTWAVRQVEVPFQVAFVLPPVGVGQSDQPFIQTDTWQTAKGTLRVMIKPTANFTPISFPTAPQRIGDFWQPLEPPVESSDSGAVLGVELRAPGQPNSRPTELPFLSTWQKNLLRVHGFVVDER